MTTKTELSLVQKIAIRNIVSALALLFDSKSEVQKRSYTAVLAGTAGMFGWDEAVELGDFVDHVANEVFERS